MEGSFPICNLVQYNYFFLIKSEFKTTLFHKQQPFYPTTNHTISDLHNQSHLLK